ncbi:MAG: hypothetical protein H7Z72_12670 [Bacteroidetes bacterium]|nr:hypothetical protein [Fibrella sp.]
MDELVADGGAGVMRKHQPGYLSGNGRLRKVFLIQQDGNGGYGLQNLNCVALCPLAII